MIVKENVDLNSIIWIQSLSISDSGTSRRIKEDLKPELKRLDFLFFDCEVNSKNEFYNIFQIIKEKIDKVNLRPIIHIDMHANEEYGLHIDGSNEYVSWKELFNELSTINKLTQNNLVVHLSVCFGLSMYKKISIDLPVPAYIFIASKEKITFAFTEQTTTPFYLELIRSGEFNSAYESHLKGTMELINSQRLFTVAVVSYVDTVLNNTEETKKRATHLKNVLMIKSGIKYFETDKILALEGLILKELTPGQHIVDQFSKNFLCGRAPTITYTEIDKLIKISRLNNQSIDQILHRVE